MSNIQTLSVTINKAFLDHNCELLVPNAVNVVLNEHVLRKCYRAWQALQELNEDCDLQTRAELIEFGFTEYELVDCPVVEGKLQDGTVVELEGVDREILRVYANSDVQLVLQLCTGKEVWVDLLRLDELDKEE